MSGTSRFALLVSKFRGCLVGSLIGDCLGTLPELEHVFAGYGAAMSPAVAQRFFAISSSTTDEAGTTLPYSIRTRMLRCVGESLLQCREFDQQDLTHRLVHENAVNKAFPNFKDELGQTASLMPSGSNLSRQSHFADSVALRTIPSAMFYYGNIDKALEIAQDSSNVTQLSPDGGLGATLLCSAIHSALQFDPMNRLNVDLFLDNLAEDLTKITAETQISINRKTTLALNRNKSVLSKKLEMLRETLKTQGSVQATVQKLKTDENSAGDSVLAAVFMFLKMHQEQEISNSSQNPLEKVLVNALTVSSTGDALAALSCSLTGAFHGIEVIPVTMRKRCQGLHQTVKLADRLALPFEAHPGLFHEKEISFVQRV